LSISHSPPLTWKSSVLSAAEEWDEPDHEPCVQNTANVLLALNNGTIYTDSCINHKQDRTCLPNTVKVSIINCIFIWIVQNLPHFLKWMLPVLCSNHQYPDHKIMSLASLEANSSMTPWLILVFVYLQTMCNTMSYGSWLSGRFQIKPLHLVQQSVTWMLSCFYMHMDVHNLPHL